VSIKSKPVFAVGDRVTHLSEPDQVYIVVRVIPNTNPQLYQTYAAQDRDLSENELPPIFKMSEGLLDYAHPSETQEQVKKLQEKAALCIKITKLDFPTIDDDSYIEHVATRLMDYPMDVLVRRYHKYAPAEEYTLAGYVASLLS